MKIPVITAFLNWRAKTLQVPDGMSTLSGEERAWVKGAIERSDNDLVRALYRVMANAETVAGARALLQDALISAGDHRTVIESDVNPETDLTEFGATIWKLSDALTFYRQLARGCLLAPADTKYVLDHMRNLDDKTDWGVGDAYPRGTALAFKGGWGPGDDLRWLVEQIAIVGTGESAYVLAIMTRTDVVATSTADPVSYYAGRRLVQDTAAVVKDTLGTLPVGKSPERLGESC